MKTKNPEFFVPLFSERNSAEILLQKVREMAIFGGTCFEKSF
jgi:hypothetical protein